MRRHVAALALLLSSLLAACSGGASINRVSSPTSTPADSAQAEVPPPTIDPNLSVVATAEVPTVKVYDAPDEPEPALTLANPNPTYGTTRVFLVREEQGDWLKVLLPVRPNGSEGWVRRADVSLTHHDYRMVLDKGAHHLTVYKGNDVFFDGDAGLGASATPTPTGLFYTTELLVPPPEQPYYGVYAYGLSAHSEVLTDFLGGDGQVGIHGTNDPSSVGRSVSNGCIRLTNDSITKLAETLPIGVPVDIRG